MPSKALGHDGGSVRKTNTRRWAGDEGQEMACRAMQAAQHDAKQGCLQRGVGAGVALVLCRV